MNLKLLSLMKKAGFVFWEDEDWKPEDAVIDWATNYDKEIEKFAELIVKDCADLFEVEWGSSMLQGTTAAYYLKQHFGVEE